MAKQANDTSVHAWELTPCPQHSRSPELRHQVDGVLIDKREAMNTIGAVEPNPIVLPQRLLPDTEEESDDSSTKQQQLTLSTRTLDLRECDLWYQLV